MQPGADGAGQGAGTGVSAIAGGAQDSAFAGAGSNAAPLQFEPFKQLLIVGVGLMGGSLGLAAKRLGLAQRIVGYSRREATAQQALHVGSIDEIATDLVAALKTADAVYLAAPVAQFPALFQAIEAAGNPDLIVFDAGSTKSVVCAAARAVASRGVGGVSPWYFQFVPSHPIAGAERHGPSAANAQLYGGRTVVVCPHEHTSEPALARVDAFWTALGARVSRMAADEHDRVFAAVSHLPHLLAYAYVHGLLQTRTGAADMQEGGGGFRDFSRIAASSPEMWVDIFMDNRDQTLAHLDGFLASVDLLRNALKNGDRQTLAAALAQAADFRARWTGK